MNILQRIIKINKINLFLNSNTSQCFYYYYYKFSLLFKHKKNYFNPVTFTIYVFNNN